MMAHDGYRQMMSLALDGMLAPADKVALEQHLGECAACTAAWEAMSGLDMLFGRATMVSPPPDFSARVMARVEARRAGRRRSETIFWIGLLALLVAVMLSQWVPVLVPAAVGVGLPALPEPIAGLAERAEPVLVTLRIVCATLGALGEALTLWLAYVASLPMAWAAGLVTLALVATWVGLIGVFSPGQAGPAARETVRVG